MRKVEEYEPSFNAGVPMELIIIIIVWVQSSRNKSIHRISLRSCLIWPKAAQVTSQGSFGAPFSAFAPKRRTAGGLGLRGSAPPHPRASPPAPPSGVGHRHSLLASHLRLPFLL